MNFKLIGALTSKPYAFKARPWELENINSIDYHDAHGTNIRISVRGTEVLRVLPGINNRINEEWISDKVRFSYDGFTKQRLFYPFLKINNKYNKISWEEAFRIIRRKITQGYYINAVVGELIDLESLFIFKEFISKSGAGRILNKQNGTIYDFRTNYLMNTLYQDINRSSTIYTINSNLRYDSPILNLKIREYIRKTGKNFFIFSNNSLLNYKTTSVIINSSNLLRFSRNKHISNTLLNDLKPLMYIRNGSLTDNFIHTFYDNLKTHFSQETWNGLNKLQINSTIIAESELNFANKYQVSEYSHESDLIFMYNTTNVNTKKGFVIYQGHTGNTCSNVADLILPGSTLLEKNGSLINNEGLKQEIHFCVKPPALARNDWKIFEALSNYLGLNIRYQNLTNLRSHISIIAPLRTATRFYNKFCSHVYLYNTTQSFTNNFYTTDIICKSSYTLALTTNRFTKNRNNFKIN